MNWTIQMNSFYFDSVFFFFSYCVMFLLYSLQQYIFWVNIARKKIEISVNNINNNLILVSKEEKKNYYGLTTDKFKWIDILK